MFYIKEGSKNRLVAKSLSHESKQRRDISQELVLDTKKTENSSNSRLVHANRSLNNSSKFCAIASHDVPAVMLNVCSKIDSTKICNLSQNISSTDAFYRFKPNISSDLGRIGTTPRNL
jgi:uncharacterized protein YgbK (DUF1537 family)